MSERGERLATWLEELGLVAHLGDAGLPALTRDDEGRAVWTDQSTEQTLDADQLEALDSLLHAEGSDPAYAVPVSLIQLARKARVRGDLLASHWFTYETLADLRGASLNATRFAVHRASEDAKLLLVANGDSTLIPAFQFTATGEPRAELAPLLTALLSAGMDPWSAWTWLTQPAALLGGLVPHLAAAESDTADLARHAAVRLAERAEAST